MKICIVSDSHDRADALAQAVREAKAQGAEAVIHCGDLIGAQTLKPALALGLPLHLIHGNNVGDPQALHHLSRASDGQLQYHGPDARIELAGRRVFVVHYHDYGYAMACTGDWELVCCGHSHQAEARKVASVKGDRNLARQSRDGGGSRRAGDVGAGRSRGDALRAAGARPLARSGAPPASIHRLYGRIAKIKAGACARDT